MIGALVAGGLICAAVHSARRNKGKNTERQSVPVCVVNYMVPRSESASRERSTYVQPQKERVVYVDKSKEKVEFFDEYRSLDVKLARLVGKKSGGVTMLINGLECALNHGNLPGWKEKRYLQWKKSLKQVRYIRCKLAHDEARWCDLPNPSVRYTQTVKMAQEVFLNDFRGTRYLLG